MPLQEPGGDGTGHYLRPDMRQVKEPKLPSLSLPCSMAPRHGRALSGRQNVARSKLFPAGLGGGVSFEKYSISHIARSNPAGTGLFRPLVAGFENGSGLF
jgi:hypothetical protein